MKHKWVEKYSEIIPYKYNELSYYYELYIILYE